MSLKPIEDSPTYNWRSYKTMKDNFYKSPSLFDIGNDAFERAVIDFLPRTDRLKILGIGSGRGELDCVNMRRMLTRFSRIDNTVVEPSAEAIEAYKAIISGDLSDRVETSWCQETLQQYLKRREINGATDKFHFISAVHSLYYVDNDGSSIDDLIDLLEKDDVLFIVIQNDTSGFVHLFHKVAEYLKPHPVNLAIGLTTSNVAKRLDVDDRVVYEVIRRRHRINATCCFEPESEEGSMVLDCLTQVPDFKSKVKEDFFQSVLDYLKTPDCSEILGDGKIVFREDWDAVIIRRN